MKRRNFIQYTALGSVIPLLTVSSCVSSNESKKKTKTENDLFELEEITVEELRKKMESGELTAQSIAEKYLKRIEQVDQVEGGLNAVLEINPDAIEIAKALDQERKDGKVRGPLHGIPIMIKDNIDTGDKMATSAGTLVLANSKAPKDAFIVKKLRDAGAVLLGKTNLSEWANFRSTRSSSGWSGRGRQTKNPYALDRSPCGSSSGSGAAVSANLCAIAIGTETNGSIVCPSSTNGVVGIKPTVGLWSRSGIIPISHTQDTAGPMARSVTDAAILLGALTGIDQADDITKKSEGKSYQDYTQFLDKNGLKGKRIGVMRSAFGFHEQVDVVMEGAIGVLKDRGATIIDPVEIKTNDDYGDSSFEVLLYEFKYGVNKYLESLGENAPVKSLKDVIEFNKKNSDKSMTYFQQEILEMAEERGDLNSKEYLEALEKVLRLSREEGIDATMNEHKLNAIIAPTGGPAWLIDVVNGDHFGGGSSSPAARSGYPNITVPAGYVHGLPVGMSMFARPYQEPQLIAMTYDFEQASKVRVAPKLPNSLKLD